MKKVAIIKVISAALAATAIALIASGCSGEGASSSGASKGLEANLEYSKAKVADFAHDQKRSNTLFSESIYAKANAAAMMITDKTTPEEYEKIARCLFLDEITVADADRKVVGSYPAGDEGKSLKELDGKKIFTNVVTNISFKQMTEPVYDKESGMYTVMAGVKRSDGTGVVVVTVTTDEYADVCGDTLAEKCGNNTVIVKDGEVISSTLKGVSSAAELEKAGASSDELSKDSLTLTADGQEYLCISAKAGSKLEGQYLVICAEPK